jgi:hypothetical protein
MQCANVPVDIALLFDLEMVLEIIGSNRLS